MVAPNRHGVYPKSAAFTASVRSPRSRIDLYLLETDQGWLVASDYQTAEERFTGPLSRHYTHYPSQSAAAQAELDTLRRLGAEPRLLERLWQAVEQHRQIDLFA